MTWQRYYRFAIDNRQRRVLAGQTIGVDIDWRAPSRAIDISGADVFQVATDDGIALEIANKYSFEIDRVC
jgi:hypothetical protein